MCLSGRMFASALLFTPVLWSQVRLTLSDAVSQALSTNPQLAAADADVGVAKGFRRQAGLAPNPRLTLQSENGRFWGDPPFSYSPDADSLALIAQTIETGGKRQRRVDSASANVQRSELEGEVLRRQIAGRVSNAYWVAAGAVKIRELLQEEVVNFGRVVDYHRTRAKEGAAPEVDLLRVELERDRLVSSEKIAGQDAARASISLSREMGKREFPEVTFADSVEQMPAVETVPVQQVLEVRAEMKAARQAVEQSRVNLRLQHANAKPDVDVQAGYKRTAAVGSPSVRGVAVDTLYGSIEIPLPIRNRNQGQIEAAAFSVKAAESSLAATEVRILSELTVARTEYEARQRLLNETLRPMRDRSQQVYSISDAAYREGGADILRLLDAERARIDTQLLYIRTLTDYHVSAVALQIAQGILP